MSISRLVSLVSQPQPPHGDLHAIIIDGNRWCDGAMCEAGESFRECKKRRRERQKKRKREDITRNPKLVVSSLARNYSLAMPPHMPPQTPQCFKVR